MANYSKLNFCIPAGESTSIRIRDISGSIRYTIYNNLETLFFNNNNTIIIRTVGDITDIILDFSTKVEAIQALSILNMEYAKIKKNYDDKQLATLIEEIGSVSGQTKEIIFSSEPGANPINNNQIVFNIPDAVSINSVIINGVVINDYIFTSGNRNVTLDTFSIGYDIEDSDEILIKYY